MDSNGRRGHLTYLIPDPTYTPTLIHLDHTNKPPFTPNTYKSRYLEELGGRGDVAGVADDRLQDDSRDLALVGFEDLLDALHVVVGGRQRGRCRAGLQSQTRAGLQSQTQAGLQSQSRAGLQSQSRAGLKSQTRAGFKSQTRAGLQSQSRAGHQFRRGEAFAGTRLGTHPIGRRGRASNHKPGGRDTKKGEGGSCRDEAGQASNWEEGRASNHKPGGQDTKKGEGGSRRDQAGQASNWQEGRAVL